MTDESKPVRTIYSWHEVGVGWHDFLLSSLSNKHARAKAAEIKRDLTKHGDDVSHVYWKRKRDTFHD